MYKTTTERLSSLLINSASLTVVRGGVGLHAEGLLKGDDLLTPQGELGIKWDAWPPEVLSAASDLLLQMEKHIAACLSGEVRSVPPPGMAIPPPLTPEGQVPSHGIPELSEEDDIAGSFNLPEEQQPKQF